VFEGADVVENVAWARAGWPSRGWTRVLPFESRPGRRASSDFCRSLSAHRKCNNKLFTEVIQTDEGLDKFIKESKTMSGAGKQIVRNETKVRITSLRNSSNALLRGVVTLGGCYDKGREVRVTVGIKPETVAAAERMVGIIGSSIANQPTTGSPGVNGGGGKSNSAVGPTQQPLTNVDEYSNTKKVNKF
jgi:hypothetical protein